MKLKTKPFGEIEVSEKQQIIFKEGLFGFEDLHSFFLLDANEDVPFYWLQSEKINQISFLMLDPNVLLEYELDISDEDSKDLELESKDDILVFTIVTMYDNPKRITANLLGPVIINRKKRIGKQIISNNDNYSVKYPLFKQEGVS